MKRLAAQFGIAYFTALSIAFYISDAATISVGSVSTALFAIFLFIPRIRKTIFVPAIALAVLIACAVNIFYSFFVIAPVVEQYAGSSHTVSAVLTDEPYRAYKKHYYKLRTTHIDGNPARVDILLKASYGLELETDDTIEFTSELFEVENKYYLSKGCYLVSDTYDTYYDISEAESHSAYYYAVKLRKHLRQGLDALLPGNTAALCKAVLIGDKYALSLSDRDNFRYAGASYFIVVSGMHFSVLILLVYRLLRRLRNRWLTFTVTTVFIVLYSAVTGFQPSVLRSAVMVFITILGNTVRRQAYPLNHLGIAGVILPFIVSPYGAGDIGMILSFNATLAILLWAGAISQRLCFADEFGNIYSFDLTSPFKKLRAVIRREKPDPDIQPTVEHRGLFFKKLYNSVASVLSVSISANILVFPISVFVFHEFSLVTLLSSVLLYLPIYLILVLSLAVCVLFHLGLLKYIAVLLAWPLYYLAKFVLAVVGFLAGLPFAFIRVSSIYVYIWLIVTISLGALAIALRGRYRLFTFAFITSFMVLLAGWLVDTVIDLNTLDLEVYSCGDGLCAGINDRGSLHMLTFDCRSRQSYDIADKLLYRYGGAQTVCCADPSELEHYDYYTDDKFAIAHYLLYDIDTYDDKYDASVTAFNTDSTFILDDDLILTVGTGSGKPVYYLYAGDTEVLVIPQKYKLDDIPVSMRSPDVIVAAGALEGAEEALSCDDLIISAAEDKIPDIADTSAVYSGDVYTTDGGDICYKLR